MNAPHKGYYIGLMTGTSMDAVDTFLANIPASGKAKLVGSHDYPLPDTNLISSEHYRIAPEWIEACLFAWLAYRTLSGLPSNVPAVTGARHEVVLGTTHPV